MADHNQTNKVEEKGQQDSIIGSENEPLEIVPENGKRKIRLGLATTIIGYLLFLLGARPSLFGLDRSLVIGFVQTSVFLIGLGIIALGSYSTLNAYWHNGEKTIAADIGSRIISTGYVVCVFTGMADIFGLGSHPLPEVFFGPLQARGMSIGMAGIAIGFLLLIRYKRPKVLETSTNKDSMISQTQFNEKEPASNSSDSTA
jgi:hypothetical protein